ncbi:MAG: CopD family protein [Flavobacteriales bacterium]
MLPDWYPALIALHVIFMVTFFAGTFYLTRVFIMHRQALSREEPVRAILTKQYGVMERQLLYLVAWPSLLLMIFLGFWMVWLDLSLVQEPWMHAKLGVTALLVGYHLVDQRIYRKFQNGMHVWNTPTLRIWVQGSVILLVAAVFLSTFKTVQWYLGILGLVVLAGLLFLAIKGFSKKDEVQEDVEAG